MVVNKRLDEEVGVVVAILPPQIHLHMTQRSERVHGRPLESQVVFVAMRSLHETEHSLATCFCKPCSN